MKKLLAVVLATAMLMTGAFAMADTLTMGTNASFEPFEYVEGGEFMGFDVELAKALADELGMELVIEDMFFDGLLVALDQGTIDMVMAAMTITEERKAGALFSDPYFNATQSVIVLSGYEDIKTVDDIIGKKVAVQDGTTGYIMATDTLGIGANDLSAFKASVDAVLELTSGRVDCVIIDNAVAENFVKVYDNLVILDGMEMDVEEYGIAIKMGNDDLLAKINEALATVKENGVYDALITKYFE